ncbi:MAG: tryptophan--tRNA ligase [Deltaproteobacteria bacterium]|nr:tryptophan--tRNA ligase [Deltaproteobacteria bacterium]
MRILSGIQPSGALHLGNYFGAVQQFIRYQDEADEALYFIADLHALTTVRDGATLRERALGLALDYLALGLDPERAILFRQSDIPEITQLTWILSAVTPMGLLERGHSFKDKTARGIPADAGLFTYPVLMSADILLYGSDAVPVGKDQKQHLEFARDIATKFNVAFQPGYDPQDPRGEASGVPGILKLPDPLILEEAGVVPGVDGEKMSSSYGNDIQLFLPDKPLKKRIMGIKTDSTAVEDPKPEPHTLLPLLKLFCDEAAYGEVLASWRTGGKGYGHYKLELLERFHGFFDEARERRRELEQNPERVVEILSAGAERARAIARPVWEAVVEAAGVGGDTSALLVK